MVEKDQSPSTSRTRSRRRIRSSHSTPLRSAKSQLSRADARANRELLPHYFAQHSSKELNLTRVYLANYSPTLWIPGYRCSVHRLSYIHLAADERPEDLYQRLMAFVEDSLLRTNGLTHHGEHVLEDEELTPSLENFVVLTWLRLIHPSLPQLVKQRYGTELRSRTLASIKPEISQALSSLLEEIRASDDAKILRAAVGDDFRRPRPGVRSDAKTRTRQPRQDKVCPLCKQAGRSNTNHFLSQCSFLPDNDRRFMVKARQIVGILDDEEDTDYDLDTVPPVPDSTLPTSNVVAYRVQTRLSPYMDVFHGHRVVRITIDSGATGNMIRHSTAQHLGCPIISSAQSVQQADYSSQLQVVGEI